MIRPGKSDSLSTASSSSWVGTIFQVGLAEAQQQPLPNIVNLQNDINGMTAEGNAIAQSVQAYNGHQQAVTTELSLCTNCPVAQMQLQLAGIQTTLADLMVLSNAQ